MLRSSTTTDGLSCAASETASTPVRASATILRSGERFEHAFEREANSSMVVGEKHPDHGEAQCTRSRTHRPSCTRGVASEDAAEGKITTALLALVLGAHS